jgi:hypothetical protein
MYCYLRIWFVAKNGIRFEYLGGRLERLDDFKLPKEATAPGSCSAQRQVGWIGILMMVLRLRIDEVLPLAG